MIPYEIIQQYKLQHLAHKVFLHTEIQKCMYVLTQVGKIPNNKLK